MPKIHISMTDLQRRALQEVRKEPGCHDVREIAINRVAKPAENNWSLQRARQMPIPPHGRRFTSVLRRDYDLLTD